MAQVDAKKLITIAVMANPDGVQHAMVQRGLSNGDQSPKQAANTLHEYATQGGDVSFLTSVPVSAELIPRNYVNHDADKGITWDQFGQGFYLATVGMPESLLTGSVYNPETGQSSSFANFGKDPLKSLKTAFTPDASGKIMGIDKSIFYVLIIIIALIIGVLIYKKYKK